MLIIIGSNLRYAPAEPLLSPSSLQSAPPIAEKIAEYFCNCVFWHTFRCLDMDPKEIEKQLADLGLQDLLVAQQVIEKLLKDACSADESPGRASQVDRRAHERYPTNLSGTLVRITDVRPNEAKEFSVTITDISRRGVGLTANTNFILSRIVELTFYTPGGELKRMFLEIVRLRKMHNDQGSWLEIGCQSIEEKIVRRLQTEDQRIQRVRNKLHLKRGIFFYVVGPDTEETRDITKLVKTHGYQCRQLDSVNQAMISAGKTSAEFAIFCRGGQLCQDPVLLAAVRTGPDSLATLAIVDDEEQRLQLYQAGLDECVLKKHVAEFLFQAIERAMVGRSLKQSPEDRPPAAKALLVSANNSRINLVSYQLEAHGFVCQVVQDPRNVTKNPADPFALVFADFNPQAPTTFVSLRDEFEGISLVALCDDIATGHAALKIGASHYLRMPPSQDEMRLILDSATAVEAPGRA